MSSRAEHAAFLRSWLRAPIDTGAFAPSGERLSRFVANQFAPSDAPIIELGAGTGALTRGLIARGIPEQQLALVEANAIFAQHLRANFPAARVFEMDAAGVPTIDMFFAERAGVVLSALPLSLMSASAVEALLDNLFRRHLREGGVFYQVACRPRRALPQSMLDRLDLRLQRVGFVIANPPPVGVYRLARKAKTAT